MSETKNQWKKKFIMVALGQAVSLLGSHGVQFALIWWLAERTASPLMLGISGLAAYLPVTLFSPAAGIAADRFNRKWISIFSDLTMGAAALIYAALLLFFDLGKEKPGCELHPGSVCKSLAKKDAQQYFGSMPKRP